MPITAAETDSGAKGEGGGRRRLDGIEGPRLYFCLKRGVLSHPKHSNTHPEGRGFPLGVSPFHSLGASKYAARLRREREQQTERAGQRPRASPGRGAAGVVQPRGASANPGHPPGDGGGGQSQPGSLAGHLPTHL